MKLSINNFKTIKELKEYTFNSINIISGVNSSGKTSFIQFLLLIKQTLETQSANPALVFDGNWIDLGNFDKLVYKKNTHNSIGFELQFCNGEFGDNFTNQTVYKIENLSVKTSYSLLNNETILSKLIFEYETLFKYESSESKRKKHLIEFNYKDGSYSVRTDTALFGDFMSLMDEEGKLTGTLSFNSFIPVTFANQSEGQEVKTKEIRNIVSNFFDNISYIGPLRKEPQDTYGANEKNQLIGSKGEFAAQILETEASNKVEFYELKESGIGELKRTSLNKAVKYWLCDVFNLAKDIKAVKYKDEYIVNVVNHFGIETTIRHVGFGISQILPIIVEGLRMDKNGILILEQPEIHLHPKIQSFLFDFIYSLSLTGKRFVIETHSDHFITRMRRRVAEDNNNLSQKINLVFVEQRETEHLFRTMNLNDMGTFDYFPDDFIEQSEEDYKAIVKAQVEKRRNKKS